MNGNLQFLRAALVLVALGSASAVQAQPPDVPAGPPVIEQVTMEQAHALVGGPTLITLRFKDAAPREVYEELFRQAGIEPRLSRADLWEKHAAPISVDIARKPFWEAVSVLEEKAGMSLFFDYGSPQPLLAESEEGLPQQMGPSIQSGPFRVVASEMMWTQLRQLSLTRRWNEADPAASASTSDWNTRTLSLQIFPDPKFALIRVADASVEEARDEKGNSLLTPIAVQGFDSLGTFPATARVNIGRVDQASAKPDNDGSRIITRLKGHARLVFPSSSELWEVPDPLHAGPMSHHITAPEGPEQYQIPALTPSPNGYSMTYEVKGQSVQAPWLPGQPRPLLRSEVQLKVINDSLSLIDTEGRVHQAQGSSGGGNIESWKYNVYFPNPDNGKQWTPVKLVWRIPVEWKEVDVPFEFTHLPLP